MPSAFTLRCGWIAFCPISCSCGRRNWFLLRLLSDGFSPHWTSGPDASSGSSFLSAPGSVVDEMRPRRRCRRRRAPVGLPTFGWRMEGNKNNTLNNKTEARKQVTQDRGGRTVQSRSFYFGLIREKRSSLGCCCVVTAHRSSWVSGTSHSDQLLSILRLSQINDEKFWG